MGGRAEASAFKDLFQPPNPFHSREQIFNSGWNPHPFPPQHSHITNTLIKGYRKAAFFLLVKVISPPLTTVFLHVNILVHIYARTVKSIHFQMFCEYLKKLW
ncbi:hypothetical protein J2Z66_007978 [Paenibacillus eucommiae]|uniref:Uncharacterized protein n=1 Tax=Paenibacillus eucommiae TaxID=1355755 RepID=A0ABS4J910_9BACL|nr:hypothetical protein [Paenibacillus eucommiae]